MNRKKTANWSLAVAAASLALGSAQAQEQDQELEEVVVTGSYLFNEVDSPSPVDVIAGDRLFEVPASNLSDFFYYDVPQNFGAEQRRYQDGGSGNHRTGARNTRINLRGLGSENTLILLNGSRLVDTPNPDTAGWRNVDISNIVPRIAIGQIQVLHDGASATYGTDAVAGVVNFMTRDNFRGFDFNLDSRYYEEDLGVNDYTVGALWGAGDDDTSIIAAFEYHDEDPWYSYQVTGIPLPEGTLGSEFRGEGDSAPNSRGLNTYSPAVTTPTPHASGAANWEYGRGRAPDPLCGNPGGMLDLPDRQVGYVAAGRGGRTCFEYNDYPSGDSARQGDRESRNRASLYTSAIRNFGDAFTLSGEFVYARERSLREVGYTSPNSSQWNGNFLDTPIFADHPAMVYNSMLDPRNRIWRGAVLPRVERTIPYLQSNDTLYHSDHKRFAVNMEGALNDRWTWQVGGSWSEASQTSRMPDGRVDYRSNAYRGLGGPDCDPLVGQPGVGPCQYYNPFMSSMLPNPVVDHDGDPSTPAVDLSNSPELLDWLVDHRVIDGEAQFSTVDFVITGDFGELPGGPVGLAAGIGHRVDDLHVDLDPISNEAAAWLSRSPADDFSGKTAIDSVFVELALPLTDDLNLQVAARNENYKDSFTNTSPKIALLWQPNDRLSVRASLGQSFKAPTVVQTQSTQVAGNAICLQIVPATNCRRGGGGGRFFTRVTYVTVGDPTLKPQESDNLSFGFDLDITDTLSVGATFLNYDFTNVITTPSRRSLIERPECHLTDASGNPVTQPDPDGGSRVLYIPISRVVDGRETCFNVTPPDPDGYIGITHSFTSFFNLDGRELQALDFNLSWMRDTPIGLVSLRPNITYLLKDEVTSPVSNDGLPVSQVGAAFFWNGQAEYRAVVNLGWERGNHSALVAGRHISPINSLSIRPVANGPDVVTLGDDFGSTTTWDAIYNYRFGAQQQGRVSLNVQNLTRYLPSGQIRGPAQGRRYGVQFSYSFEDI